MSAKQKPCILVIDDDDEIRQLLNTALACAGFQVRTAEDGESGLEKIQEQRPELILLDMVMPGLNGWGVLRRLPPEPPPLPVIAMSGEYVSPAALGLMHQRVRAYVMKPLRLAHLVQTCNCILSAHGAALEPMTHERRSENRCIVLLPVTILDAGRRPLAVGRATNLSRGGLQVYLGADISAGQEVRLSIEIPPTGTLQFRAMTRWSNRGFAGLSFVQPTPDMLDAIERVMFASRENAHPTKHSD